MSTFETIINVCSLAANIAIVITMIYGIKKLKQDKQSVVADLDWRRKNETILFSNEILEKTDNLLAEINKRFNGETINVSDFQNVENTELEQIILKYLTLMERLSVGLNTEVYDLDVYARICRRKTIMAWKQLENIAYDRRKTLNNDKLYKEFEDMVGKLNDWILKPPAETRGNYNPVKWRMFSSMHNAEK